METNYNGHWVRSFSRQKPDSDRWVVKVHVLSPEAQGNFTNTEFEGPLEGFASQAEAESWGIQHAQKWIDDEKPDLRR